MSRAAARDGAQRSLLRRSGCSFRASPEDISPTHKKAARLADCFFSGADDEARPLNAPAGAAARTRSTEILRRRISPASRVLLSSLARRHFSYAQKSSPTRGLLFSGADDEARTRYLHLGKVALYRMSYIRMLCGFVNVYIIHTDRTVVKHYFPFFTVGITRRASKMTSDIRTSPKNSQARPNKSRAYFIFTFTVPFR